MRDAHPVSIFTRNWSTNVETAQLTFIIDNLAQARSARLSVPVETAWITVEIASNCSQTGRRIEVPHSLNVNCAVSKLLAHCRMQIDTVGDAPPAFHAVLANISFFQRNLSLGI